jgi:hypothetical protein
VRRSLSTLLVLAGAAFALGGAAELPLAVDSALLKQPAAAREAAARTWMAATPVQLTAGRAALKDALARLGAGGNTTTLAPGVDDALQAELPALSGDYWQGVAAICSAYGLTIEPGELFDQGEDNSRQLGLANRTDGTTLPVAIQGGPVVLSRRIDGTPPALLAPCGPLLAQVVSLDLRSRRGAQPARWLDAVLALRFEPRVAAPHVGATQLTITGITDTVGRHLDGGETPVSPRSDGVAVHLTDLPERLAGVQLSGDLGVLLLEPVVLTAGLHQGDSARADLLGQEATVRLLGENDTGPNGQKGPGLNVSLPTQVIGSRPHVRVLSGGQPVQFSNQGSQWNGGRLDLFYRGHNFTDAEYAVEVSGQAAVLSLSLPLRITVNLAQLPTTEAGARSGVELQVPTRLEWPAGRRALSEALHLLSANEGLALLELGTDEQRGADLPAFNGTFWEGVLAVARAYDLAILPPARSLGEERPAGDGDDQTAAADYPPSVAGGPVCLGLRRPDRRGAESFQACGVVLVGIDDVAVTSDQGLGGINRNAEISYCLRLEPHLDAALVGEAKVTWTTLAGQAEGHPLVVAEPAPANEDEAQRQARMAQPRMRFVRVGRRMVRVPIDNAAPEGAGPTSGTVTVGGLPAVPATLALSGQVTLTLRRPARAEAHLDVGGHATVQLAGRAVGVRLVAKDANDEERGNRSSVVVDLGDGVDAFALTVRSPLGKPLRCSGTSNNARGGRMQSIWYFPELEPGVHTLVLTAREHLTTLRLPFTLAATTP